jgi:hypothetical protein
MVLSVPIAADSLAAIRARSTCGRAMALMIPMVATTISSSISVNPAADEPRELRRAVMTTSEPFD